MSGNTVKTVAFFLLGMAAGVVLFPSLKTRKIRPPSDDQVVSRPIRVRSQSLPSNSVPVFKTTSEVDSLMVVEKAEGVLRQLQNSRGSFDPGQSIWLPLSVAALVDFTSGRVGEHFSLTNQTATAYGLDKAKQRRLDVLVNRTIESIRANESRYATLFRDSDEQMTIRVPAGIFPPNEWAQLGVGLSDLVGKDLSAGLLSRIRGDIEREYPPQGRAIGIRLVGDKGVSVQIVRGNGLHWQNSFPESISHLVLIAENGASHKERQ